MGCAINAAATQWNKKAAKSTLRHGVTTGIVTMLLKHGADANVREQSGYTALHAAAQNGDVDTIRALLLGGADLTLKSDDGKTALDIAMDAGHAKATLLLGEGVTRRFRQRDE